MYSYLNRHRIRKSFQNKQKISERERHEKVDSLSELDFFQLPYKPHRPTASVCTLHTKDNYGRNSIVSAGTTDARPLSTELRPIRTRRPFPRQKSQHTCLSTHRHQADPGSAYSCEVCTWHAWSGVGVPAWRSSPQKMCSWLFHV